VALYLTEGEVERLLSMDEVIAAVEGAFRKHGEGAAETCPAGVPRSPERCFT